jgi:hypothetical protein
MRAPPAVPLLDPDPDDPRLRELGDEVAAWADGDVLTIAARRPGRLVGTFGEKLRPAGEGLWALRFRIRGLPRATIEFAIEDYARRQTWRGPLAPPVVELPSPIEVTTRTIADSPLAHAHRVSLWSPPDPQALLLCADGDGMPSWAGLVAAAKVPVALVGIASAATSWREHGEYDPKRDPRARAYIPMTDPPYFEQHMTYVTETVLPWAEQQLGRSFAREARGTYGSSNGAVWAASAANLHPSLLGFSLAFSLGAPPAGAVDVGTTFALVAGRLEPGFDRATTSFAWQARGGGARVRLRRRVRGHDFSLWRDEFLPALRWALGG